MGGNSGVLNIMRYRKLRFVVCSELDNKNPVVSCLPQSDNPHDFVTSSQAEKKGMVRVGVRLPTQAEFIHSFSSYFPGFDP